LVFGAGFVTNPTVTEDYGVIVNGNTDFVSDKVFVTGFGIWGWRRIGEYGEIRVHNKYDTKNSYIISNS
jgi:hypothetical protein